MDPRKRIERLHGRHALVDGIPFSLPVDSRDTPALMAAFPISAARAAELLPGEEVHPLRLGGDVGLLLVTVVDYRTTDIGSYIEYSLAIACTHGLSPAPRCCRPCCAAATGPASSSSTCPSRPRSPSRAARGSGACPSTRRTSTS